MVDASPRRVHLHSRTANLPYKTPSPDQPSFVFRQSFTTTHSQQSLSIPRVRHRRSILRPKVLPIPDHATRSEFKSIGLVGKTEKVRCRHCQRYERAKSHLAAHKEHLLVCQRYQEARKRHGSQSVKAAYPSTTFRGRAGGRSSTLLALKCLP
jgi:hypothetical protein